MTNTAAPAYPATNTTITRTPAWPAPFLQTIKDLERARLIAVHLEQELAHVDQLARALAADLVAMDDATAIDLDRWPHARALVDWAAERP